MHNKLQQSPAGCLGEPVLEATSKASAEIGHIQASIPEDTEAKDVMQPYWSCQRAQAIQGELGHTGRGTCQLAFGRLITLNLRHPAMDCTGASQPLTPTQNMELPSP